jgi:tetratricopeptide (TPR) repeat protein
MTFLQHHRTRHLQMKVRFSRWDDILATTAPAADLPHAVAIWNYARGRALAARGDTAQANVALERLRAAAANPTLAEQRLEFNTSGAILAIATEVLAGHIAASTQDVEAAVEHLRAGAKLEDALTYGEPPDWSVPVRQELGMVLLKAARPAEAEQAFREDLKRFPENGWSLRGLELALRAQNRTAEADTVKRQFDKVWATADVTAPDSTSASQTRPPIFDMQLHADLPPHEVAAGEHPRDLSSSDHSILFA